MISVVLCKINEEINYVSIFHNHVVWIWLRNPPAKLLWNRNKKIVATDVMLGIYSLIWTICHKLVWFYRNAVSFHIIFVMMHGEIFSHLGHTGPLTVNKMALASMYRRRWRHIHAFLGRNMIALMVQRFAAGANIICLTYATDWWAVIGPVIHGESNSWSSSDHVGLLHTIVNNRHSRVKTQGALCIGGFGQTDGRRKFELGIPQSRGASYIRGASFIRDKTVNGQTSITWVADCCPL